MALTRNDKQETIERYQDGLASAPHAFLVNFQGITVPQATDLRNRVRDQGATFEVVKNTLARRAVEGRDLGQLVDHFQGPTAVAYSEGDPVSLAKALTEFRKEFPVIEFKGGMVEGKVIDASDVDAIAQMPSREELLAKLLFLLQSPITRLARGLAAIPRQLVVVLDQIEKQKAEG
jgi:large subunit ribosomal protein L10